MQRAAQMANRSRRPERESCLREARLPQRLQPATEHELATSYVPPSLEGRAEEHDGYRPAGGSMWDQCPRRNRCRLRQRTVEASTPSLRFQNVKDVWSLRGGDGTHATLPAACRRGHRGRWASAGHFAQDSVVAGRRACQCLASSRPRCNPEVDPRVIWKATVGPGNLNLLSLCRFSQHCPYLRSLRVRIRNAEDLTQLRPGSSLVPPLHADGDSCPPAPSRDLSANGSTTSSPTGRSHLLVLALPTLVAVA